MPDRTTRFERQKKLLGGGPQPIRRAPHKDDAGPGVQQRVGHVFAESGTGPGDEGATPFQRKEPRLQGRKGRVHETSVACHHLMLLVT